MSLQSKVPHGIRWQFGLLSAAELRCHCASQAPLEEPTPAGGSLQEGARREAGQEGHGETKATEEEEGEVKEGNNNKYYTKARELC